MKIVFPSLRDFIFLEFVVALIFLRVKCLQLAEIDQNGAYLIWLVRWQLLPSAGAALSRLHKAAVKWSPARVCSE